MHLLLVSEIEYNVQSTKDCHIRQKFTYSNCFMISENITTEHLKKKY